MPKPPLRIALVASVSWSLWNYRLTLILALQAAGYEVQLYAAEDFTTPHLLQLSGVAFFPLREMSRSSISPLKNLKSLLEMRRQFRRNQPDLILFFTIRPNTLGNLAAMLCGIPGIANVEGMGISEARPLLRRITRILYRAAFRNACRVVFLNRDDLEIFVNQGIITSKKAALIHGPGVDMTHFAPSGTTDILERTVFLFMARLLPEKGIREFVQAARMLRARGLEAEFQVLGDIDHGNPTSIQENELLAWKEEGVIHHLGFLEDVRPALAKADFMVLPSYYREGVPRSVLEAMSMEKPVITTDSVGCRDTVVDGKNGFLIPPRDVPALAAAMERAQRLSATERVEMGRASRQMIVEEFGDRQIIPQYLALIRAFFAAKAPGI